MKTQSSHKSRNRMTKRAQCHLQLLKSVEKVRCGSNEACVRLACWKLQKADESNQRGSEQMEMFLNSAGCSPAEGSNAKRQMLGKWKGSFTEEAGSPGEKGDSCPKEPTPQLPVSRRAIFRDCSGCIGRARGPNVEATESTLTSSWNWSCSGLMSIILIVLILKLIFNSTVIFFFFLFPWGQFLELCKMEQFMQLLPSDHHAIGFFQFQHLWNSSVDITHSPWGGTKDPWLCFMAKLLFCLAWLFPFAFAFSHFSN